MDIDRGPDKMKTIGLIGGMSWESSLEYYRLINEGIKERLGGLHSARCLLDSVEFAEVEEMQREGRWEEAGELMAQSARNLERGGAEFIVLCTNTMHKLAPQIEAAVSIPFLHIADATARRVHAQGLATIGLLGTRFTMEQDFYKGRLEDPFGLRVLVPKASQRDLVHHVIYDELCLGVTREASRQAYRDIIGDLVGAGAQGVILGCTEIGMLVKPKDSPVPLFDTTRIHAEAAVEFSLS
jgi:aspartate racemase